MTKLFPKKFPDSVIASAFKCSRTKTSYMLADGISISYLERLKNKLRTQPFTLMIDESNKIMEKIICASW